MSESKSILIHLNTNLEISTFTYTKISDETSYNIKNIFSLSAQKHKLELSNQFSDIWASLWDTYLKDIKDIYYFIGPEAGFTDSRIVFLWLKSWHIFSNDCNYHVGFEADDMLNEDDTSYNHIQYNYLKNMNVKTNIPDLSYLKAPRITIKEEVGNDKS
jgi:hypothetical protein